MVETRENFAKRLNLLGRKHAKMTRGYTTKVDRNGMLTVKPGRKPGSFPLMGILMLVGGFFAFKAFMLAAVGPVTYNERLAKLENGSSIERAGARVLGIDPVTQALANFSGPVIR